MTRGRRKKTPPAGRALVSEGRQLTLRAPKSITSINFLLYNFKYCSIIVLSIVHLTTLKFECQKNLINVFKKNWFEEGWSFGEILVLTLPFLSSAACIVITIESEPGFATEYSS